MKAIKLVTAWILMGSLLTACHEDILEKYPLGEASPENFFTNEEGLIMGTNATYEILRGWNLSGYAFIGIGDIASDDADKGGRLAPNPPTLVQFDNFTSEPTNNLLSGWYSENYVAITRANLVLVNIDNVDTDEALKNRLKAENRFIRAFAYFNLVKVFGGVPIVLEPVPISTDKFIPRSSEQETYAVIDGDLKFAITHLPEKSEYPASDLGRVTKGAARALLAKTYLFRGDFANVEKYALEVINSGEYDLYPDYEGIFRPEGENNVESVFEVQASTSPEINIGTDKYNTAQMPAPRGWGINWPSEDLENAFEPGDPRKGATILYKGETMYDGVTIDPPAAFTTLRYNKKAYVPFWEGGTNSNDPGNVRLIRYADVLLMAAEAMNENGKPHEALTYLNKVRERARAGNPDILPEITVAEKSALREKIWHERRVELAMEQHRFFDLVRQGRAGEVMRALGKNFVEGVHEKFPFPQIEINATNGALEQNPGYD
jgi:hypothetical protein